MDILYRTQPPVYRGCNPQPTSARSGFLSGLWCYLFGGGTAPNYRTKDVKDGAAVSSAPRCWWQAFPSTPLYKAAPQQPSPDDTSLAPASGTSGDPPCGCNAGETTGEDVPSTVYIVTG